MKKINLLMTFIMISVLLQAQPIHKWEQIEKGIELTSIGQEQEIWVFKINQEEFRFKGKMSGEDHQPLSWFGNGVNLAMFHDWENAAGYLKLDDQVIQPTMDRNNMFMCWNENEFQMIERNQVSIDSIFSWSNVSQNIRMVSSRLDSRNRWQKSYRMWSVTCIAVDDHNNVLLINSREPYTMNDFIDIMLSSQLHIQRMGYLEGGPESGIIINEHIQRVGSYETGFNENDNNEDFWPLPFALTFERKL